MNTPISQTIEIVKAALQSSTGNTSSFVVLTHPNVRKELIAAIKLIHETIVELHEKEEGNQSE